MLCRVLMTALAVLALHGCGNSDNQINGGTLGGTLYPNGFLPDIRSAIAGSYTRTDSAGHQTAVSMFILTDEPGLCTKLAAHPDYYKTPSEGFVALILTTAAGNLGSFVIGFSNGGTASMVSSVGPGHPVGTFTADLGNISLRSLNLSAGGESQGSFDVGIHDATGIRREVFGKFKTSGCDAIAGLQF